MRSFYVAIALAGSCLAAFNLSPSDATAASGASRCDRQPVMQIDSARISVEPAGFTIDAFGVAESAGWSNPTLVVSGAPVDGVATVDFVACRPEVSAQVLTPIQVRQTLALDRSKTRQIIIHTKTNSMTVEITQPK